MKKVILKTLLAGALVLSIHAGTQAQVSVNINIGNQPAWGPTGYNHVDYYYLPDVESYYDVSTSQYIYQEGGRWIFARNLPARYRNYDLYSGYKVVVNRPKPYLNFNRDRVAYGRYKNWSGARQPMLREHRDNGNHFGNNVNRPGNGNMNRPDNNGNNGHGNYGNNRGNNGNDGNGHGNNGYSNNRGNNGNDNNGNNHGNDNNGNGHGNGGNNGRGH
jgi:hypothetical protein